MTKQEFIRKISSRKFWVALIGNIIGVCSLLTSSDNAEVQVVASVILIICSNVAYILGESKIDAIYAAQKLLDTVDDVKDVIKDYQEKNDDIETTNTTSQSEKVVNDEDNK